MSEPIRVGEQPPRAPNCPADRTTMGRPCEGPGSYYCDDSCERVALRAGPPHVVDNLGRVWLLIKGGGICARVVTEGWDEKVQTAGIAWLAREHGPLLPFDSLQFRRDFPRSEAAS